MIRGRAWMLRYTYIVFFSFFLSFLFFFPPSPAQSTMGLFRCRSPKRKPRFLWVLVLYIFNKISFFKNVLLRFCTPRMIFSFTGYSQNFMFSHNGSRDVSLKIAALNSRLCCQQLWSISQLYLHSQYCPTLPQTLNPFLTQYNSSHNFTLH